MSSEGLSLGRLILQEAAIRHEEPRVRLMGEALSLLTAYVPAAGASLRMLGRRSSILTTVALQRDVDAAALWELHVAYVVRFQAVDPLAPHGFADPGAPVLSDRDVEAWTEFEQSEYAIGYLAAQGLRYQANLYIRHRGSAIATASLFRRPEEGPFSDRELNFMRRLHPLLEAAFAVAGAEAPDGRGGGVALTEREYEIARLIAEGRTNPEIGAALHLSPETVKKHLTRVYTKLGLRSRAQLAALLGPGIGVRPSGNNSSNP